MINNVRFCDKIQQNVFYNKKCDAKFSFSHHAKKTHPYGKSSCFRNAYIGMLHVVAFLCCPSDGVECMYGLRERELKSSVYHCNGCIAHVMTNKIESIRCLASRIETLNYGAFRVISSALHCMKQTKKKQAVTLFIH